MSILTQNKIRVSIGSAGLLGLRRIFADVDPTTCYIMTYSKDGCEGRCRFCPQGYVHEEGNSDHLSRVQWPEFSWNEYIEAFGQNQNQTEKTKFKRICIQVLNTPRFFTETLTIIEELHKNFPKIPISAAIPPISKDQLQEIRKAGLERIGIALDACTPELFLRIKGYEANSPYLWKNHWAALHNALDIFGKGYVTTHFIVGLGETEEEMINAIANAVEKQILPGIFLFTPIRGTPLADSPRPGILQFRHIQLARALLLKNSKRGADFVFEGGILRTITNFTKADLEQVVQNGFAFKTAGCPDCNRPYYTSRPGEEPDGYPRNLTDAEKIKIFNDLIHLIERN